MGEFIQKVETAVQSLPQMTRYRALETMDEEKYNPVKEIIQLSRELKQQSLRDYDLEYKMHSKLLEYFSAAPKKQMSLDVQGTSQIMVLPVSYSNMYEGKDLSPCKPQLIDIIPKKTVLEELMDGHAPDSNPEPC